jgi:hypothetical protein
METKDSPESPEAREPGRSGRPTLCAACGYPTDSLAEGLPCPECGGMVRVEKRYLHLTPEGEPDWVRTFRPVIITLTLGGAMCLAASVSLAFRRDLGPAMGDIFEFLLIASVPTLLLIAPLVAVVITIVSSHRANGSHSAALIVRHALLALGAGIGTALAGFLVGVTACVPACMT